MMTSSASVCRAALVAAVVLAVLCRGRAAHGQSAAAKAQAEALYNEGLALKDAGRCDEAVGKLQASQALSESPSTAYFLGECLTQTGRIASAWARFRESAQLARRLNLGPQEARAEERALSLEPRLPYLLLTVEGPLPAGLAVVLGETTLDAAALGVRLPLDPGFVEVRVVAPGHVSWTRVIELVEGQTTTVKVPPLATTPPPPREAPLPAEKAPRPPVGPPVTQASDDEAPKPEGAALARPKLQPQHLDDGPQTTPRVIRRGGTQRGIGIAFLWGGLIAGGFGAYFALQANTTRDELEALCPALSDCTGRAAELHDDWIQYKDRSKYLIGGGSVATVLGLIVYFTAAEDVRVDQSKPDVGLLLDDQLTGAYIRGTF